MEQLKKYNQTKKSNSMIISHSHGKKLLYSDEFIKITNLNNMENTEPLSDKEELNMKKKEATLQKIRETGPNRSLLSQLRECQSFLIKKRRMCYFCKTGAFIKHHYLEHRCEQCGKGANTPMIRYVNEKVFLGNEEGSRELDSLKACGITDILIIGSYELHFPNDFNYKKINVQDKKETNLLEYFEESNQFIENASKVFVHCHYAISRSPSFVIAYLMWKERMSFEKAMAFVKEKSVRTSPNRGFRDQLNMYEKILKGQTKKNQEKDREEEKD